MGKMRLVYKDRAGNRLYKRYIKTRKKWQWSAKNREGKVVTRKGVKTMIRRAVRAKKVPAGRHIIVREIKTRR